MSNQKQIAVEAIRHWIGHETAHLSAADQIIVSEEIAQACLDIAEEVRTTLGKPDARE